MEAGVFGIRLRPTEDVADCLRVLGGEHYSQDLAAVFVVLENLCIAA